METGPMEPDSLLARVVSVQSTDEVGEVYAYAARPLIGLLTALAGGNRADAEEVAQESFVRLIENWPRVRDYDDPEAWLRTVAVRAMISRHRRRDVARRALSKVVPVAAPAADTDDQLDLGRALAQLPIAHRAVVLMHYVDDLPVDEVARRLRIPAGTVKSRLSRARAALAPMLTDEERSTT
jgi:RNA polymerase sigma-70 factor (ECF subfamily)